MRCLILTLTLLLPTTSLGQTPTTGAASGRITGMDGAPISGIRVGALETSYPRLNIASQGETDKDGRFRLVIAVGEYFIIADPFTRPSYYPGVASRDDAKRVAISPGENLPNLDFKFVAASGVVKTTRTPSSGLPKFSGVIRDVLGKPLPNITVALTAAQARTRKWTVTNASGDFEFSNLTNGSFSVATLSPEFDPSRGYAATEELAFPLTLAANETVRMELGLRRFGNADQRPDLYAPVPSRPREGLTTGVPPALFWRYQKLDEQQQPRASNKGVVDVQLKIDSTGELQWIRVASVKADPELARSVVETVGQWNFLALKVTNDRFNRFSTDEGDPTALTSTVTFTFPKLD
jgi:TonB family protein